MTVVSRTELERMRASVRPEERTAWEARRQKLQELSDAKVKSWPNTLEAMRQKKESWKMVKMEEEEKARVEIDRQEAELQKEKRLEAINRANAILYEQTDRIKGLRSQQLYSEVVHERKGQILAKAAAKLAEAEKEKEYHFAMVKQLAQAERREEAAAGAHRGKARAIACTQREQLDEFRHRHLERLKTEKKEGDLVLKRAVADLEEDERLKREKLLLSRVEMQRTLDANKALKELRRERELEEQKAESTRQSDLKRQQHLANERKRLEKERFQARQATKQKLIDRAARELELRLDEDNRRLERQVEEMRKKEDDLAAKKLEIMCKQKAAIDESRRLQLEAKHKLADEEVKETQELVALWKAKNIEIEQEEAAEAAAQHRHRRDIREALEKQIEANCLAKAKAHTDKLAYDGATKTAMCEDDERYRESVAEVIKRAEQEGKPTYMLHKAMHASEVAIQPASGLRL